MALGEWAIWREFPDIEDIFFAAAPQIAEFTELAKHYAQVRCPVDQGRLIQTIRVEDHDLYGLILVAGGLVIRGEYVHYAAIVHDGLGSGRNATPRPFLVQGIRMALAKLERDASGPSTYTPTVMGPFGGSLRSNRTVVETYAVPSHIGFGNTPIGRIPKGQPGAGRFFSLKPYLD